MSEFERMLNQAKQAQAEQDQNTSNLAEQERLRKEQQKADLLKIVEETNLRLQEDPRYEALVSQLDNVDLISALQAIWNSWKVEEKTVETTTGFFGKRSTKTRTHRPEFNPTVMLPEVTREMFTDPDNKYGPPLLTKEQSDKAITEAISHGVTIKLEGGTHIRTEQESYHDDGSWRWVDRSYPNMFSLNFRYDDQGEIKIFDSIREFGWSNRYAYADEENQGLNLNETLQIIANGIAKAKSGQALTDGLLGRKE